MHPLLRLRSFLFFLAIIFVSVDRSTALDIHDNEKFKECSRRFSCGSIRDLSYPFWGDNQSQDCGLPGYEIECQNSNPVIKIVSQSYSILSINNEFHRLTVVSMDMKDDGCPNDLLNITLGDTSFDYAPSSANLTFVYNCSHENQNLIPINSKCPIKEGFYVEEWQRPEHTKLCGNNILVPVLGGFEEPNLKARVKKGFELEYKGDLDACSLCTGKIGGQCGYDRTGAQFTCFVRAGLGGLSTILIILASVFFIWRHRYERKHVSLNFISANASLDPYSKSDPAGDNVHFGVPIFP